MSRNAVALRAFSHGDEERYAAAQVILSLDAGQFTNWEHAGLIREATAAEIAKARGDKPPRKPAGKRPSAKKAKPAAAAAAPEPATEAPTSPDPAAQARSAPET